MKVTILYSLPTARMMGTAYGETDADSAVIAQHVETGLRARGYETEIYPVAEDKIESIREIKTDVVFNLIEWCGRDIELSVRAFGYLKELKKPVTGSSQELFVLSGDKVELKKALEATGASTPKAVAMQTGDEEIEALHYPVIVKPALEHCSTGLSYDSIAHNEAELKAVARRQIANFGQRVLAEEYVVGRELLVYLVQERGMVRVLPIEEVIFSSDNPLAFQTYESKWEPNHPDYQSSNVVVATLSSHDKEVVERTSREIFERLGFNGYARFDVRLRDGIPYYLETNANPSVYDGEGVLQSAEEEVIPGIKFGDYLVDIVESAKVL